MVCRGILLMLHRAGEIELPLVRYIPPNPLAIASHRQLMLFDTTPIRGPLISSNPSRSSRCGARPTERWAVNSQVLRDRLLQIQHEVGVLPSWKLAVQINRLLQEKEDRVNKSPNTSNAV